MKTLFLFAIICCAINLPARAQSSSFSLDSVVYEVPPGSQFTFSVDYDFTEDPIFGGCFDLYYDTELLDFVNFTHTDFNALDLSPSGINSPEGFLESPGHYEGPGLAPSNFITGVNDAGPVGVFTFNVITNLPNSANTPCGRTLCLERNAICPVVSLQGYDITDETLANGISEADVFVNFVDSDGDFVQDHQDNCTNVFNPDQYDSNEDGFGNACDADWNNDCVVNFADYALLPPAFSSQTGDSNFNPDLDVNGDGNISFLDVATFSGNFLGAPGPSNVSCSNRTMAK